jgi:magnesium chelatase subunit D
MSAALGSDAIPPPSDSSHWEDALLVAQLLAVDPVGLGGVVLRAAPGPVRDRWLDTLRGLLAPGTPLRRLPSGIQDDRLLGGIDLPATLKAGRPILQNGLLAEAHGGLVMMAMAERASASLAARIAAVLDRREVVLERDGLTRIVPAAIGIVALDEGIGPDEQVPAILSRRLAFYLDLQDLHHRDLAATSVSADMRAARAKLREVHGVPDDIVAALTVTAARFGIESLTAPLLALRVARASAALAGRDAVDESDAIVAARLVLAPRARSEAPSEDNPVDADEKAEVEPPPESSDAKASEPERSQALEDVMRDAVQAALPAGLLDMLKNGAAQRSPPSRRNGTGATQTSLSRGRPVGVRMAPMRAGARLALVETLRAAAPWQPIRRAERGGKAKRIEVRQEDLRIRKFAQRRESTIVFCVDASGSAAFHRLAEAKGAVELLLGEAYVARTYAALIAFRGAVADLMLPPSRSLTRAKALLSTLPGGGGTPLAAGIDAAMLTALGERAKGRAALLVFLTDGQANIARDGQASRALGFEQAMVAARQLAVQNLPAIFVDTSPRAREEGARLACAMGARYIALPQAHAAAMRDVVRAAMP